MNNFLFENGTRFLFGGGCVKEYLASFLRKYGPSVLLVTEEGERRSGAADEVRDILRRRGKQASECTVGPFCPRYDQVQQAARLCRERRVDLILGVGGSAVLDGCKAASLAAVCRGDLWENFGELQGVVDVPPLPVGFVASHLEAGAVNGASGLIHENQCVWRDYPPCDPRFALLDPARTCELSRRELLFQGFSALAGALEPEEMAHLAWVAEQPENLANSRRALADYIALIREEGLRRSGTDEEALLRAAQKRYQETKAYMEEKP